MRSFSLSLEFFSNNTFLVHEKAASAGGIGRRVAAFTFAIVSVGLCCLDTKRNKPMLSLRVYCNDILRTGVVLKIGSFALVHVFVGSHPRRKDGHEPSMRRY